MNSSEFETKVGEAPLPECEVPAMLDFAVKTAARRALAERRRRFTVIKFAVPAAACCALCFGLAFFALSSGSGIKSNVQVSAKADPGVWSNDVDEKFIAAAGDFGTGMAAFSSALDLTI